MRVDVHPYDYRIMTASGEVLQAGSAVGIPSALSAIVKWSGFDFSYQVVHRALRAAGIWLASYRPEPSARPVVLIIERAPESFNQLPPP